MRLAGKGSDKHKDKGLVVSASGSVVLVVRLFMSVLVSLLWVVVAVDMAVGMVVVVVGVSLVGVLVVLVVGTARAWNRRVQSSASTMLPLAWIPWAIDPLNRHTLNRLVSTPTGLCVTPVPSPSPAQAPALVPALVVSLAAPVVVSPPSLSHAAMHTRNASPTPVVGPN